MLSSLKRHSAKRGQLWVKGDVDIVYQVICQHNAMYTVRVLWNIVNLIRVVMSFRSISTLLLANE